jgi:hypothetical protein
MNGDQILFILIAVVFIAAFAIVQYRINHEDTGAGHEANHEHQ